MSPNKSEFTADRRAACRDGCDEKKEMPNANTRRAGRRRVYEKWRQVAARFKSQCRQPFRYTMLPGNQTTLIL